jgi:hypothetical protein
MSFVNKNNIKFFLLMKDVSGGGQLDLFVVYLSLGMSSI